LGVVASSHDIHALTRTFSCFITVLVITLISVFISLLVRISLPLSLIIFNLLTLLYADFIVTGGDRAVGASVVVAETLAFLANDKGTVVRVRMGMCIFDVFVGGGPLVILFFGEYACIAKFRLNPPAPLTRMTQVPKDLTSV
jgi:hypothetical protein